MKFKIPEELKYHILENKTELKDVELDNGVRFAGAGEEKIKLSSMGQDIFVTYSGVFNTNKTIEEAILFKYFIEDDIKIEEIIISEMEKYTLLNNDSYEIKGDLEVNINGLTFNVEEIKFNSVLNNKIELLLSGGSLFSLDLEEITEFKLIN